MSQKKWKRLRKKEVEVIKEVGRGEDLSLKRTLRENWMILGLILLLTVIIYFNSLWGGFVSDDYASISQNPQIGDLGVPLREFSLPTWSNYILAKVFGINSPIPYHVFCLGMFLLVLVCVYLVGLLLFGKMVAIFSTAIFGVMPIHVEAVSWISGKPYLFNALFVLISFIFFIMLLKTRKNKYLKLFLLSLPLTFVADKIRSFSLLLIVPLFLISFEKEAIKRLLNAKVILIGGLVIVLALIFLGPKVYERVVSVNSGYNASESIFYNPFFQYPTGLTKYFQLLWLPTDLTLYHTMYTLPVWLNWAVFLAYLGALAYFFMRNKSYFFALAFIVAGVLPSMMPVKVSWLVAERYIFLGSFGFALLIGLLLRDIWDKRSLVAVAILAVGLVLGSTRIYLRNIDWQTNHNLWVNTCQVSPNSHNAWNNIGDDYDKLADYENAIKGFTQSTLVKPNYADAFHNRANIFFKIGRLDLARDSYNTALYFSPNLYQTYISLTQIDLIEKRMDLAVNHAQEAAKLQPSNPQTGYVLGVVYAQAGRKDEAIGVLKSVVGAYPDYQPAREALNNLLVQ